MNYFLHIKPQFDCLMRCCGSEWELSKDKIKNFLLKTDEENIILLFYPVKDDRCENNYLPFSVKYNIKSRTSSSLYAKTTLYPDDNVLLDIKPFYIKLPKYLNIKSKTIAFALVAHTIYYCAYSTFALHIENNKKEHFDIDFDAQIQDIEFRPCGNELFAYAKTLDGKHLVCLLSYAGSYKLEKIEIVDLLEKEQDKILTYKDLKDDAGHGERIEYSFDEVLSTKTELVYNQEKPKVENNANNIPMAFLQAIKVRDLKLARSYLASTISQQLDDRHVVAYFNDFVEIGDNLSNAANEVPLIYDENGKRIAKIYHFDMLDNKISNITN